MASLKQEAGMLLDWQIIFGEGWMNLQHVHWFVDDDLNLISLQIGSDSQSPDQSEIGACREISERKDPADQSLPLKAVPRRPSLCLVIPLSSHKPCQLTVRRVEV